ncbi:MAG: hypothetical protein U1E17_04965 [Geminicoccaceae bacterium]
MRLSAVNSINWARVVARAVYYVWAGLRLGAPDRPVAFCVPSGNFGNVYAGRVAAALGLPVAKLVVATNENDILARFLASGEPGGTAVPTTSPSMDIQVASNFERLLLRLDGHDPAAPAPACRRSARAAASRSRDLCPTCSPAAVLTRPRSPGPSHARRGHEAIWSIRTGVGLAVAARQELPPGLPLVTPRLPTRPSSPRPSRPPAASPRACRSAMPA